MLTVLLGVGGGFVMVPAMIYLLGMSAQVVVGTSLLQILFVTAATTMIHATTTQSVDIVLAGLLLLGSVIGAQFGARSRRRSSPSCCACSSPSSSSPSRCGWRSASAGGPRRSTRSNCCERRAPLAPARRSRRRSRSPRAKPTLVPDVSDGQVEIRYCFTGAELLLFGAILYPGGRVPTRAGRHRRRGERAAPADRRAREAEGRRHLDERRDARFRSAPVLLRGRLVAAALASWSTSAPRRSTSSASQNLQLSPGGGALADMQRRFEAGLIDLMQRASLYAENPHGVEISDGVLYRARDHHPGRCRSAITPPRPS